MTSASDDSLWSAMTWSGADGTQLFARDYHPPHAVGAPVVCLPGVTRNSRDFHALAVFLTSRAATPRRVIAMDFRGRGRSGYAPASTYTPQTELDDVLRGLDAAEIDKASFVGTSRGGLVIMGLAVTAIERIGLAILNDIGPRLSREGLQRISSYVGAENPETWDEAIAALKATQGMCFPKLAGDDWIRLARQIFREEDGRPVYDYDPALKEAFEAFGPDAPLPDFWPAFYELAQVPTLAIRGALSDILSTGTLEAMRLAHPKLSTFVVPDQGHAPLLWTWATQTQIAEFLDRNDRPQRTRRAAGA